MCVCKFIDSSPKIGQASEINRRLAFIARLLPLSRAGMNLFCSLMDIGRGFSWKLYYACLKKIHSASKTIFESVLKRAVKEEKQMSLAIGTPTVSGNHTWKKRGFTSNYDVTTIIGRYTTKVDAVIKSTSTVCLACREWANRKGTAEYEDWFETHKAK